LVEELTQLPEALSLLENKEGDVYCDGEFDHVGNKNRMALLTLLRGNTAVSFHFPSLFRPWENEERRYFVSAGQDAGVRRLFTFIQTQRVITWGGHESDLPALSYALPALPLPLPLWFDLQREVKLGSKDGRLPTDSPIGLAKAVEREFGVRLNKRFRKENWRLDISPNMLAYAAVDVAVLVNLLRRFQSGTLFKQIE